MIEPCYCLIELICMNTTQYSHYLFLIYDQFAWFSVINVKIIIIAAIPTTSENSSDYHKVQCVYIYIAAIDYHTWLLPRLHWGKTLAVKIYCLSGRPMCVLLLLFPCMQHFEKWFLFQDKVQRWMTWARDLTLSVHIGLQIGNSCFRMIYNHHYSKLCGSRTYQVKHMECSYCVLLYNIMPLSCCTHDYRLLHSGVPY